MIKTLENLGARMLNRIVPKAVAAAGGCSCDPGSCWCKYYSLRSACCCNSDCNTTTCFCSTAICGPW